MMPYSASKYDNIVELLYLDRSKIHYKYIHNNTNK